MECTVVSATNLKPDDHFFLAGVLYRVFAIYSEPFGTVQIKFTDSGKRWNEEGGAHISTMEVPRSTVFQVLR